MDEHTEIMGASDTEPVTERALAVNTPAISTREAAQALAKARYDKPKEAPAPVVAAVEQPELAPEADGAPAEEQPSAETAEVEPAQEPPIDPPKSWTKAEKERFATFPRETQEYLATREQERDAATRRSQNEAAEKLKGLTAKEQAVEQARTQYESALPILLQNLQATHAGEFADLKTMADVQKMAAEDWPRYIRWDANQKQIAAVQQEAQSALQRQHQEKFSKFAEFAKAQDAALIEDVPEMADPKKAQGLQAQALKAMKALGFEDDELGKGWQGEKDFSLRDARVQQLIIKAARWDDAQAKAQAVTRRPVPQVQRPGTAQPAGAAQAATVEALGKKLDGARNSNEGARIAAQMLHARRAARR